MKEWILEMPIQEMVKLTEFLDHSEFETLAEPALLVFSTDDDEFSIMGFGTLEEATSYMEVDQCEGYGDGYELESAYFEGREMTWTEVRKFDFVEKKKKKKA